MNILMVTETYLPFIAGVSTSTDSISRYMAAGGHSVTIVSPKPIINKHVSLGKNMYWYKTPSIADFAYKHKSMTPFPWGFPLIWNLVSKNKFDLIHIQEPGSLGITALIIAKIKKIPTVGGLHFTPEQVARMVPVLPPKFVVRFSRFYTRIVYNRFQAVMVPTQTFVNMLKMFGVKTPCTVVSNGVDIHRYKPLPKNLKFRENNQIPANLYLFFFLGRLDKDKNVSTIIKALPYADKKIGVIIAGSGKEKDYLIQLAKDVKAEDRVYFFDQLTEDIIIQIYRTVDAFVIMAPYEVQSIVTLQAIASGLPVIAADAGALPELCQDGKNGFLVDTYDYVNLADKMNRLAANGKLSSEFGKQSRVISIKHHKPTALHKLELLYRSLI